MYETPKRLTIVLQAVFVMILLTAIAFLMTLLPAPASSAQAQKTQTDFLAGDLSNSSNVVTSGAIAAMNQLVRTTQSAAQTMGTASKGITSAAKDAGSAIVSGSKTAATTTGQGAVIVGEALVDGVGAVIGLPGKVLGALADTSVIRSVIRPSDHDANVPIIDPDSPELRAALVALPPEKTTRKGVSGPGPVWPVHGRVTTEFGVNHWPYQDTHTGMDIADGTAPGVTPIKPFRPGKVIDVVHSWYGLGNHVVVDHGNGVTSVYAHLASISVQKGQKVTLKTELGREGTTGVSTGTHLHFEIRVHGQAANPRQFISGQP